MTDVVMAGAISAVTAIIISVIGVIASRRKDEAGIASQLTGSALEMVESARADCRDFRQRLMEAERKIDELKHENRRMVELIDELWDGIIALSVQLHDNGIDPIYKPGEKPVFRGSDDAV